MAEPSERDKQQAQELADGAHEAGLACGDCQDGANGYYICNTHLEPIARAIASAREGGRRAGLEEAASLVATHRAAYSSVKGWYVHHNGRPGTPMEEPDAPARAMVAAIRALIGGNE